MPARAGDHFRALSTRVQHANRLVRFAGGWNVALAGAGEFLATKSFSNKAAFGAVTYSIDEEMVAF